MYAGNTPQDAEWQDALAYWMLLNGYIAEATIGLSKEPT